MDENGETKTWLIALKLILIATVLIGAVGLALWFASQLPGSSPALEEAIKEVREKSPSTSSSSGKSWGLAKDSPIRK
jgi:hypothetical protein